MSCHRSFLSSSSYGPSCGAGPSRGLERGLGFPPARDQVPFPGVRPGAATARGWAELPPVSYRRSTSAARVWLQSLSWSRCWLWLSTIARWSSTQLSTPVSSWGYSSRPSGGGAHLGPDGREDQGRGAAVADCAASECKAGAISGTVPAGGSPCPQRGGKAQGLEEAGLLGGRAHATGVGLCPGRRAGPWS